MLSMMKKLNGFELGRKIGTGLGKVLDKKDVVVEVVKAQVDMAFAKAELKQRRFNLHFPKSIHGIEVIEDELLLRSLGYKVAVYALFADGSRRIVIDSNFYELSENAQKFVLYHEQGHIVCGHEFDGDRDRLVDIDKGIVSSKELEADAYAVSRIGVSSSRLALEELKGYVNRFAIREIDLRIAALE